MKKQVFVSVRYIILCRLSSSRLPGKMLMKVRSNPLLWYPIESLSKVTCRDNIVVATSVERSDDPIAAYCSNLGIHCFRGDLDNVALRFKNCLEAYPSEYAVRICGDNVFVNKELLEQSVKMIVSQKSDFLTNTEGRTFPYGMSIEIIRSQLYLSSYARFDREGDHEHVMPYFYRSVEAEKTLHLKNEKSPQASGLKLAIDTYEDLIRVRKMLMLADKSHYDLSLSEIETLSKKAAYLSDD